MYSVGLLYLCLFVQVFSGPQSRDVEHTVHAYYVKYVICSLGLEGNGEDMDCSIKQLLSYVEEWLMINRSIITSFYIGKTSNYDRRASEHLAEGYVEVYNLANGDAKTVGLAEESLIDKFINSTTLKDKCDNLRPGADGNPEADELYLAIKKVKGPLTPLQFYTLKE